MLNHISQLASCLPEQRGAWSWYRGHSLSTSLLREPSSAWCQCLKQQWLRKDHFPAHGKRTQGFTGLATGREWVCNREAPTQVWSGQRRHSWEGSADCQGQGGHLSPSPLLQLCTSPPCRSQQEETMGTRGISWLGSNKQAGGQQVQKADSKNQNLERPIVRSPHQKCCVTVQPLTHFFFSCFVIYLVNQSICCQVNMKIIRKSFFFPIEQIQQLEVTFFFNIDKLLPGITKQLAVHTAPQCFTGLMQQNQGTWALHPAVNAREATECHWIYGNCHTRRADPPRECKYTIRSH